MNGVNDIPAKNTLLKRLCKELKFFDSAHKCVRKDAKQPNDNIVLLNEILGKLCHSIWPRRLKQVKSIFCYED